MKEVKRPEAFKRWAKVNHEEPIQKIMPVSDYAVRKLKKCVLTVEAPPSLNAPRTFRRYPNRKIYDEMSANYVNFSFVFDCLWRGWKVHILHAKSKQDMTFDLLSRNLAPLWIKKNIVELEGLTRLVRSHRI